MTQTRVLHAGSDDSSLRRFVFLVAILVLAALVRGLFPLADPPVDGSAGIVWHDEGAWVHNARNRVLFGTWITDAWNPLFITPVLTGLEYVSFQMFGVGLWQARLVSQVLGVLSVAALAAGLARIANPLTGLIGAALLATSYTYVMYDRAAVMEATMMAFLVIAWWCYVRASQAPAWSIAAAVAAFLAFFSKASAVFFVVALGLDAVMTLGGNDAKASSHECRHGARWTLTALAVAGALALAVFVVPHWDQYRFYNWETSVTRRPSYSLAALKDRVTWFPIVHDFFTRMWPVTILGMGALTSMVSRFRDLQPGERLLIWWIGLGTLELIARDVGNERYFVYLAPALVALAALAIGRDRRVLALADRPAKAGHHEYSVPMRPPISLIVLTPVMAFALYVGIGSLLRVAYRDDIFVRHALQTPVRLSAALAGLLTLSIVVTWPRMPRALSRVSWNASASIAIATLVVVVDLVQFGWWASDRTYKNYTAMRAIGEALPPDALVHGKLANGLSLESRIRPVFVGRRFGNYDDRLTRDDVPFVVTYVSPSLGYEGAVIREVLEAYPDRRMLMPFDVAETPSGHDRAALFEKWPGAAQGKPR